MFLDDFFQLARLLLELRFDFLGFDLLVIQEFCLLVYPCLNVFCVELHHLEALYDFVCYAVQSFIVLLEGVKVLLLIFVEGPFCFFANVGLSGHLRFIDVLVDGPKQINEFCLGLPVLLFEQTFLFGLNLCPIDLRVEFILQQV